jgi:F-type H+-transporting ATPase subunit b
MRKLSLKSILLLLALVSLLAFPVIAMAQEGETSTEETAEGEAAAEGGEEAVSPLEPLGINAGYLLAQIINFGIIFGALSTLLWRPIINMLDARSAKIQKGLEDAAAAASARLNAEAEAEKILAAARTEAQGIIAEARGRGEEVAKTVETEARTEAESIRAQARTAATEERDTQLAGLRSQVGAISIALAQRLIGSALDEKRQQALIDDFFAKVPASAKSLGGSIEVVSAMPLSESEQAKAKQEIGAQDVTFTVDPGILGGLIIRSQDKVVDGSVRSGLSEIAGRLG